MPRTGWLGGGEGTCAWGEDVVVRVRELDLNPASMSARRLPGHCRAPPWPHRPPPQPQPASSVFKIATSTPMIDTPAMMPAEIGTR